MPLAVQPGPEELLSTGRAARPGRWLSFESSRVSEGRYDGGLEQVHVIFKDGTPWTYNGVPRSVWRNFRRSASPGRYINRVLNSYGYWQGGFSFGEESEV
jgi:hypothetical protein